MNKKGLSMISMLIYVVLFFSFSAFAIGMATNMNYRTLTEKGKIINMQQLQKLQYNLLNSARNSRYVERISDKIVFSNNDEYYFDETEKKIYKNGGIIATDVESLEVLNLSEEASISTYLITPSNMSEKFLEVEVTFNKYNQQKTDALVVSIGGSS